jgi:16S rRNA (guanine966-N2)-methyltransferase
MRIIGGKFKGRKFYPPADKWPTRPTTDNAKEALFNIIHNYFNFEDLKVLDLFGGTGNHCYEFISRGCTDVTYVDKHKPAIEFVKKVAETLQIQDYVHINYSDVFLYLERAYGKYNYIFAGPPYALTTMDMIPDIVFSKDILAEDGWFVMEHNHHHNYKDHPKFWSVRNYGKTYFSIFVNK